VYEVKADPHGLVNIPSSMWLFRMNRKVELILDSLNLPTLRLLSAGRSIKRAADKKKVIHLWAHPHEFRTEKDFEKLRFIFEQFAEQAKTGKLQSITMTDLAHKVMQSG